MHIFNQIETTNIILMFLHISKYKTISTHKKYIIMRIIGGKLKGKKLVTPSGDLTRPTLAKTREAVFNIVLSTLWHRIFPDTEYKDATVLDVFAGTGALGIEALSRGASKGFFMDNDRDAYLILQENTNHPYLEGKCEVLTCNAMTPPPPRHASEDTPPCHLVFMDPPYKRELVEKSILGLISSGWLPKKEDENRHKVICIAEMSFTETINKKAIENIKTLCNFDILDERKYGKTKVVFMVFY
jgi:16S rRNA (guanine966-N2)-methyltransferase